MEIGICILQQKCSASNLVTGEGDIRFISIIAKKHPSDDFK